MQPSVDTWLMKSDQSAALLPTFCRMGKITTPVSPNINMLLDKLLRDHSSAHTSEHKVGTRRTIMCLNRTGASEVALEDKPKSERRNTL